MNTIPKERQLEIVESLTRAVDLHFPYDQIRDHIYDMVCELNPETFGCEEDDLEDLANKIADNTSIKFKHPPAETIV